MTTWTDQARDSLRYRRSLASRVILLTTIAVGLTAALLSVGAYVTVRLQLQDSLDRDLVDRARAVVDFVPPDRLPTDVTLPPWAEGAANVRIMFIRRDGFTTIYGSDPGYRLGREELEVAAGRSDLSVRTIRDASGNAFRVVAVPTRIPGNALVIAESLEEQQRLLGRLGLVSLLFGGLGMLVAGVAGWAVATNGLRPVRRLTTAVEGIARTEELRPIEVEGADEVARLATAFNQMLLALDASRERQRRLVADAGHELRTPLTSLRTNVDLLTQADSTPAGAAAPRLAPEARRELLEDIAAQIDELTTLIGDLTELSREESLAPVVEPVDLSEVLEHSLARVRRRAPALRYDVRAEPWWVMGESSALERAVTNLLDNAAKWSPPGGTVTVRLADGMLVVDDEGPGIAEEDRPHVFERFWRAEESRTMPGSGLGLAIVRQVVERHSGHAHVDTSPAGGCRLVLTLPGTEAPGAT